jgi:hypothetical protein
MLVDPDSGVGLGAPYRQVPVIELSRDRDPFSVDPALVERGLRGHVPGKGDRMTSEGIDLTEPSSWSCVGRTGLTGAADQIRPLASA